MSKLNSTVSYADNDESLRDLESQLERARASSLLTLQSAIIRIAQSRVDTPTKVSSALRLVEASLDFEFTAFCSLSEETDKELSFFTSNDTAGSDAWKALIKECGDEYFANGQLTNRLRPCPDMEDKQVLCYVIPKSEIVGHTSEGMLVACQKGETRPDCGTFGVVAEAIRHLFDAIESERELRQANDRFMTLSNSLPGVVYQRVVTPEGDIRYTYISESAKDIFGISADEILSNPKALFNSYAPEYREHFRKRLLEASKTLTKWDVEASIVLPDGSVRFTHAIASPQKQADGSVLWTGVILDASRIKEAERQAAETEEATRSDIVENLGQGFVMFDAEDKLTIANTTFLEAFGPNSDIIKVGMSYADFIKLELDWAHSEFVMTKRMTGMLEERLDGHERRLPYESEFNYESDRWFQLNEHRTKDGNTVLVYTDVSAIKIREARIQHMAMHDALTGLPNRMLFKDRSELALKDMRRFEMPMAILALDLDNFKTVNDTMGHPAGDRLLQTISTRIKNTLRETDTLARLGGDEFAVVMRDIVETEDVDAVCERVIAAVGEPVDIHGSEARVGVSIGVALCEDAKTSHDDLLKNADLALYRAKEDGKNVFRYFEREMDELAQARRLMEIELRKALNESNLELHFQPQVNVALNEITGFEALVRWNHPERGTVAPAEFIQIAEETGLINQLGDWVLLNACKYAAAWPKPSKIAVNVSAAQFKRRDLVEKVQKVLDETGLDPARLELEITESMLLHNTADVLDMLFRLKGLGVRVAMDDFGTGYSSLGNLRSFPFDRIKIDKSFILSLDKKPESAAIIKAIVGLGNSLGMNTTAEGVETLSQLERLRDEGCTDVQGFYYSHALPNDDVEKMLLSEEDSAYSISLQEE